MSDFNVSRLPQPANFLKKKTKSSLTALSTTIPKRTGCLSKASLLPPLLKPSRMNFLPLGLQLKQKHHPSNHVERENASAHAYN
jgi:hypothetical protein